MNPSRLLFWHALASAVVCPSGCGGDEAKVAEETTSAPLAIFVTDAHANAVREYVAGLGRADVGVARVSDPIKSAATSTSAVRIALVADLDCGECWRIDRGSTAEQAVVHAGNTLSLQFGLSEVLEKMGFRFFHPKKILVPKSYALPELPATGELVKPMQHTRGIQLHTLHPIEALYDFWMPSEEHFASAKLTIDWVIKNRGNFIHWVALDNIDDEDVQKEWLAYTRRINDYAHMRGVRTSIGFQLFGTASLQRSYILVKAPTSGFEQDIEPSLVPVLKDAKFDHVGLAFGEFSAAPAEALLSGVNETYAAIQRISPGTTMSGTIHVGDDLKVSYMGEELVYYFLIKYARPEVLPWVHTVMYYTLFEDAGGAYKHENFFEHRDFLLDRLKQKKPVSYHPESAYWVSFDNSVPMYLPLYVRSRWYDLFRIEEERLKFSGNPLEDHVLFSSGWEWGYWQNDVVTLRMGVRIPETFEETLRYQFEPYGNPAIAEKIAELAKLQHQALIVDRLAAYLAGRDEFIDIADKQLGKIAQPDRPTFDEVMQFDDTELSAHEAVIKKLEAFAEANEKLQTELEGLGLPDDPFLNELRDGFSINKERAWFVFHVHAAVVSFKKTGSDGGHVHKANEALARGLEIVKRRHAHLLDGRKPELTERQKLPTLYQFGYLHMPDSLCLWRREKVQLENLVFNKKDIAPGCTL